MSEMGLNNGGIFGGDWSDAILIESVQFIRIVKRKQRMYNEAVVKSKSLY